MLAAIESVGYWVIRPPMAGPRKTMVRKVRPTGGATHYYATTMPKAPAWADKAKEKLRLGHHIFFKDVP